MDSKEFEDASRSNIISKEMFDSMRTANLDGVECFIFRGDQALRLLKQPNTKYLGVFPGYNEENYETVLLCGLKEDGTIDEEGIFMELAWPCPPYCGVKDGKFIKK